MIERIRNVAIIAHVDHGKTTLVDKLLAASGTLDRKEIKNEHFGLVFDLIGERTCCFDGNSPKMHHKGEVRGKFYLFKIINLTKIVFFGLFLSITRYYPQI